MDNYDVARHVAPNSDPRRSFSRRIAAGVYRRFVKVRDAHINQDSQTDQKSNINTTQNVATDSKNRLIKSSPSTPITSKPRILSAARLYHASPLLPGISSSKAPDSEDPLPNAADIKGPFCRQILNTVGRYRFGKKVLPPVATPESPTINTENHSPRSSPTPVPHVDLHFEDAPLSSMIEDEQKRLERENASSIPVRQAFYPLHIRAVSNPFPSEDYLFHQSKYSSTNNSPSRNMWARSGSLSAASYTHRPNWPMAKSQIQSRGRSIYNNVSIMGGPHKIPGSHTGRHMDGNINLSEPSPGVFRLAAQSSSSESSYNESWTDPTNLSDSTPGNFDSEDSVHRSPSMTEVTLLNENSLSKNKPPSKPEDSNELDDASLPSSPFGSIHSKSHSQYSQELSDDDHLHEHLETRSSSEICEAKEDSELSDHDEKNNLLVSPSSKSLVSYESFSLLNMEVCQSTPSICEAKLVVESDSSSSFLSTIGSPESLSPKQESVVEQMKIRRHGEILKNSTSSRIPIPGCSHQTEMYYGSFFSQEEDDAMAIPSSDGSADCSEDLSPLDMFPSHRDSRPNLRSLQAELDLAYQESELASYLEDEPNY